MRNLYTRRTELSNRGTIRIKDSSGRLIYLLVGKWGLSPGVLSVYNVTGERLAEIKQRTLGFFQSLISMTDATMLVLCDVIMVSAMKCSLSKGSIGLSSVI